MQAITKKITVLVVVLGIIAVYWSHSGEVRQERVAEIAIMKKAFEPFDKLDAEISVGLKPEQLGEQILECRMAVDKLAGEHLAQDDLEQVRLSLSKDLEDDMKMIRAVDLYWDIHTRTHQKVYDTTVSLSTKNDSNDTEGAYPLDKERRLPVIETIESLYCKGTPLVCQAGADSYTCKSGISALLGAVRARNAKAKEPLQKVQTP